jgi:acyl carrier protein
MVPDIKATIVSILQENIDLSKFTNIVTARFEEDLKMDSLDTVEFIVTLEKQLEMTIDERYLVGVKTVQDLITAVSAIAGGLKTLPQ